MQFKQYIGDGVYVAFDGFGFVLTVENEIEITNTIVLEPSTYSSLVQWVEELHYRLKKLKELT